MNQDDCLQKDSFAENSFYAIISDVDKALNAEAYLAALALMLTIPDICAKAEYGDSLGGRKRYIKWFDKNIGQYNCASEKEGEPCMPYLSGELVYQLRCSVLHEGSSNVNTSKIEETANKIDSFALIVETEKPFGIYMDFSRTVTDKNETVINRTYQVNIRRLWMQIKAVSLNFYEKNKEKFEFCNYRIIDWDQRTEILEKLNRCKEDALNK